MPMDVGNLRDFYRTPLGRLVRRELTPAIRARWKNLDGLSVAGAGFSAPYLGTFRLEAARLACLMPARQGAIVWPRMGGCHSVLVGEAQWPLPDNSIDRLLAVHCLEQAERPEPLLREMWRVLKPDGRILVVVPNRRGLWSRLDRTPFGYGLPYSRAQLETQLTDAMFTPSDWGEGLFFPPFRNRFLLRTVPALERFGAAMSIGVAGVIVVEATKEVMAPIGGNLKLSKATATRQTADTAGATGVRRR
ncbi:methyltransferase type 11 [Hyphomicrobium methylovorum]|uniref:class I SAM-dependent methyltransferase n=1 Tax=Hyphomicrobium methylovorum TaxID=84 RepID=UPI0015E6BFFA|nr:class I SAM-dependent methyltransferase [Hyphomicrobium methylovorum]MBA2125748.1 methyltransferase type 11 [Hyphomicrobium methylovorum]